MPVLVEANEKFNEVSMDPLQKTFCTIKQFHKIVIDFFSSSNF